MNPELIYIASDHAGFPLKRQLLEKLTDLPWKDLGPFSEERVDYPDFADLLAGQLHDEHSVGVLVCGSGQGMAIRANRFPHIRAALCWNEDVAKLARAHNDANVLCLGSRTLDFGTSAKVTCAFFETDFEGGRHGPRVEKLGTPYASG